MSTWAKWITGGGGTAIVALGLGALEVYRRFIEIRTAAVDKALQAEQLLEVGVAKAGEAGVLQIALNSCYATERILVEALKTCQ